MERAVQVAGWLAVFVVTAYWLAYVCVAPVTTADSHIYNLARLELAARGGAWTNTHQIVFPWSFDAVHMPWLAIGRCENLPSFLCLLGLGALAVLFCRRQGVANVAPVAVLVLLASPTVVFQASTSKNDLAVAFFALAGVYALQRWRERGFSRRWLAVFAVTIGMCAGAKTTGLVIAAILLAAAGIVCLRLAPRRVGEVAVFCGVALALWGSVETYLGNRAIFGAWMGPPEFIAAHRNPDGVAGGLANLVRYAFNSLGSGLESEALTRDYRVWLTQRCSELLGAFGLAKAGLAPEAGGDPKFLLGAHEVASNYGVVGLAAVVLAIAALVRGGLRTTAGRLAALGFLALAMLCVTMGWQKFNMRFLLPAAVPLLVSAVLFAAPTLAGRPGWRLSLQVVLLALALAVPLCSWNRTPRFLAWAWRDRETVALQENLPVLRERDGTRALAREHRVAGVAIVLGERDWALPYLRGEGWVVISNRTGRGEFSRADLAERLPPGAAGTWLVLASQRNAALRPPAGARLVAEFRDAGRAYLVDLGEAR
jgi:4-amino-4-deoxy-L-arabinose transferase-like glycosyltransferase